jgi:aspartyl-tRNA synthetase
VHRSRDLGALIFLDLRDRAGVVQVSFAATSADAESMASAAAVGVESVVLVEGEVTLRPSICGTLSSRRVTWRSARRRSASSAPPETPVIPVARSRGAPLAAEELRLRYRYLDLRRPSCSRRSSCATGWRRRRGAT